MSCRTLKFYYQKKAAGLCVNCGKPKGIAEGVRCLRCSKEDWKAWEPGSRGRPPHAALLPRCFVCQKAKASDGKTCAICKARVKRLKGWKGLPALKRILTLL